MGSPSWGARSRPEHPAVRAALRDALAVALACGSVIASGALSGCGSSAPSATLRPPPLPRASATPSPSPTPAASPIAPPTGADPARTARIAQAIATLRGAPRGTTVRLGDSQGAEVRLVASAGSAGPDVAVSCASACPPQAASILVGDGFAPPPPSSPQGPYTLGALPGSDAQLAVFVERIFLEALGATPQYTLVVTGG